jgi:aquaporin Z
LLGAIVAPCVALIAVSPLGRLSGAHINPAVTLGFWALGRVSRHDLVGYVVAQFAGRPGRSARSATRAARVGDGFDRGRRDPSASLATDMPVL